MDDASFAYNLHYMSHCVVSCSETNKVLNVCMLTAFVLHAVYISQTWAV